MVWKKCIFVGQMGIMDLQARKINLIEYLIDVSDENLLAKIESIISFEKKGALKKPPILLSEKELVSRALKSNEDYSLGRFKTQDQLEEESENW